MTGTCYHCQIEVPIRYEKKSIKIPLWFSAITKIGIVLCPNCGNHYEEDHDYIVNGAIYCQELKSITFMLKQLEEDGYKKPYMERVLGLQQGTMKRWEGGYFNKTDIALLRIVFMYPETLTLFGE